MASRSHSLRNVSGITAWFRTGFFPSISRIQHVARSGVLRAFLAHSRHHFVPDDLSCEDRVVRTDLMVGANQVTDHYLVALARHHRLTLATLDEPLANTFANESELVELIR